MPSLLTPRGSGSCTPLDAVAGDANRVLDLAGDVLVSDVLPVARVDLAAAAFLAGAVVAVACLVEVGRPLVAALAGAGFVDVLLTVAFFAVGFRPADFAVDVGAALLAGTFLAGAFLAGAFLVAAIS